MMLDRGFFLISLDFELQWGSFDKINLDEKRKLELSNTLLIIPKLLETLKANNIQSTWATVGMLFNESKEDWLNNIPKTKPNYLNKKLCPYEYFSSIEKENYCFFFAHKIIELIINTPKQELASHTYSHYYCLEDGQHLKNFEDDILQAKKIFSRYNKSLESLVFPRNQFNKEYYKTCNLVGIKSIRTNPSNWYWDVNKKDNYLKKAFRLIDAFNLFNYDKCYKIHWILSQKNQPYKLPASRFLKSYSNIKLIEYIKLTRIKLEMTYAARYKRYYHIWWHPENFGKNPNECLIMFNKIIKHYLFLNKKYKFQSTSMTNFVKLMQLNN